MNLYKKCPKCEGSDFIEKSGKVGHLPEHKFVRQVCQTKGCSWVSEKIFRVARMSVADIEKKKKELNDASNK